MESTQNKNIIKRLIKEYSEIFNEICELLNYTFSTNVDNYSEKEINKIASTLRYEYRSIYKEL